jgi:hypothetical protein
VGKEWRPAVLVLKEKHGDSYYNATTREAFEENCLTILKQRFNEGYWYNTPDEVFPKDSKWDTTIFQLIPDFPEDGTKEEKDTAISTWREANINVIPDEEARALVAKKLSKAIKNYNERSRYIKWYKELERVVAEEDKEAAWRILDDRSDYEYEGISLENMS